MIVKKIAPGEHFHWTDRDHFIYGEYWYRVVEISATGRIKGEFFWLDEATGEVHRSTILTETGLARDRPI